MSLFGNHKKSGDGSLFSGSTGTPSPHHKFDWGAAALSFMGVDPNIFIGRRRQQDAEAQQQQVNAIIDADTDLSPQDKAYAKLDPKSYITQRMTRYQTRTLAPNDEIATPTNDPTKPQIYRSGASPSETERTAAYFESIGRKDLADAYRAKQATTIVQGVDAGTGQPIVQGLDPRMLFPGPQGAPQAAQGPDATPTVEDGHAYRPGPGGRGNPANWIPLPQGGPGRSGPATFP